MFPWVSGWMEYPCACWLISDYPVTNLVIIKLTGRCSSLSLMEFPASPRVWWQWSRQVGIEYNFNTSLSYLHLNIRSQAPLPAPLPPGNPVITWHLTMTPATSGLESLVMKMKYLVLYRGRLQLCTVRVDCNTIEALSQMISGLVSDDKSIETYLYSDGAGSKNSSHT